MVVPGQVRGSRRCIGERYIHTWGSGMAKRICRSHKRRWKDKPRTNLTVILLPRASSPCELDREAQRMLVSCEEEGERKARRSGWTRGSWSRTGSRCCKLWARSRRQRPLDHRGNRPPADTTAGIPRLTDHSPPSRRLPHTLQNILQLPSSSVPSMCGNLSSADHHGARSCSEKSRSSSLISQCPPTSLYPARLLP